MKKNTEISERIIQLIDFVGVSKNDFAKKLGYERSQSIYDIVNGKSKPSFDFFEKLLNSEYSEMINIDYIISGKGRIEKTKSKENPIILNDRENDRENDRKPKVKKTLSFDKTTGKRPPLTPEKAQELQNIVSGAFLAQKPKLIPVYGVSTIGGTSIGADMSPVSEPEGYIEAGGWFPSVTAAIYHYGNSMEEYPAGVLLALQEVYNHRNIIWGSNYVIETPEIRITKRLQTCPDDKNYVMAYSSNKETYPDGRLVHEPITIHKEDIKRLFLVIGIIKKEQMSAPILIKPNKGVQVL